MKAATALRVELELAHRADRLQAPLLARLFTEAPTGQPPRMSRARVVSEALRRGLAVLEAEVGVEPFAADVEA